jgi:hypothetical protein
MRHPNKPCARFPSSHSLQGRDTGRLCFRFALSSKELWSLCRLGDDIARARGRFLVGVVWWSNGVRKGRSMAGGAFDSETFSVPDLF